MVSAEQQFIRLHRFNLKGFNRELGEYYDFLKKSCSSSPWFESIVFRSVAEADDRERVAEKYGINLLDLEPFKAILIIGLRENYFFDKNHLGHIIVSQISQLPKMNYISRGISISLEDQWELLIELVKNSNSPSRQ